MNFPRVLVSAVLLACSRAPAADTDTDTVQLPVNADSVWNARLRSSVCRRPSVPTSKWPQFLTGDRTVLIRIPPFLSQAPYQVAQESAKGGQQHGIPYGTQWFSEKDPGFAQFSVSAVRSVKLVYPGGPEPEESICLEDVAGAKATILASNRGVASKTAGASTAGQSSPADTAGPLGPRIVFATMRFPDGLSLQILGTTTTAEQQNELLAAIRTINRVAKR